MSDYRGYFLHESVGKGPMYFADLRAHGVHHENTLSAAALNQFNVTLIETMLKCHYYCQFQSIFTVEIGPLDEWRDVYFSGR